MRILKLLFLMLLFINITHNGVIGQDLGTNTQTMKQYLPPDIYHPPGRKIKLKKLDLNNASLEQLLALPYVNEDLALKIMKCRPIKTLQDLYRVPYISSDRMDVIIKGLTELVTQPEHPEESEEALKQ